tara:strand:- start:1039 stop:2508 length:1470 start_codon:yes stop_codon:yes gene_type:complete
MSIKDIEFRTSIISGLRWSAIKRVGQALLSVVVTIIMARLLTPSDFGLVAMATVFTGISNVFTELGTGEALIRKKNASNNFISSVFWLNTGLAIFVCIILFSIAPSVSKIFDEQIVEILIYVLSIEVFLSGLNRVSHALLEKNMRFKAIAFAQIMSQICGACVGISMAFFGYGLWSLVFLGITGQLVYTIISNVFLRWTPSLTFNIDHIKNIFSFSSYLTSMKILDHVQRRSEIFVVTYLMGSYLGGIYSQTFNLMRKPIKLIGGFMVPVLFSAMSSVSENLEEIKTIYLKSVQSFLMIYIPISIILFLYSEPFVLFVLGDQWFEMIPLIPVFGGMLLYWSLHKCNVTSLKSIGRVDLLFKMYAVYVPISILGCILGAQFGIFWVAISMLITTCSLFISSTIMSLKIIRIDFKIYLKQISTLLFYGLLSLIAGYFLNNELGIHFDSSNIVGALIGVLVILFVYIGALLIKPVPACYHLFELLNIKYTRG